MLRLMLSIMLAIAIGPLVGLITGPLRGLPIGLSPAVALAEELPAQEPLLRLNAGMHMAGIWRLSASGDGRMIATGSDDKTVKLWSSQGGELTLIGTLRPPIGPGNDGKVYAVALAPDATWVAAGGWDAYWSIGESMFVNVFDTAGGGLLARLGPLPNAILRLAVSADGRGLAAGLGGRNGIRVWHVPSAAERSRSDAWQLAFEDTDYDGDVYGLGFLPDGGLATTSYDGMLRRYDVAGKRIAHVAAPGGKQPYAIAAHPDGKRLAVGYYDTTQVDVVDATSLKRRYAADTTAIGNGHLSSVTWSADGSQLFAAGRYDVSGENPLLAWTDAGKGARRALRGPQNTVMELAPLPGGGLAVAGADPALGLLDAAGRRSAWIGPPQADLRGKLGEDFTVSDDGRRLRLGLGLGGKDPHLLELAAFTLTPAPAAAPGLAQADIASLPVTDWKDTTNPKLAGKPLALQQYETSRSLAILPGKAGLVLGTEWSLRRFDAGGSSLWQQPAPDVAWGVNLALKGDVILAAYGDGTIRWHRASDGVELLALYIHIPPDGGETQMIAWTPKGYYKATPGAERLIGWHVNRSWDEAALFYPAGQFREQFYRPDIVDRVLDTLDEEKAIVAANAETARKRAEENIRATLLPVVRILSPADGSAVTDEEVTLRYTVESPSGLPITAIDIRANGQSVGGQSIGGQSIGSTRGERVKHGQAMTTTLRIPRDDVTITVVARTGRNASEAARLHLVWRGKVTPGHL